MMNKKDKHINRKLSKLLYEFGIKLESELYWTRSKNAQNKMWHLEGKYSKKYIQRFGLEQYPAYDVAELIEIFNDRKVKMVFQTYEIGESPVEHDGIHFTIHHPNKKSQTTSIATTPANAMGEMLIHFIKNTWIKVKDLR